MNKQSSGKIRKKKRKPARRKNKGGSKKKPDKQGNEDFSLSSEENVVHLLKGGVEIFCRRLQNHLGRKKVV